MATRDDTRRRKADGAPTRQQDPEGTRRNILEIASQEFALNGLSGARIDEIAARTRSSKRMIYYYFGDKEGLYLAALENAYRLVREGEAELDTDGLPPVEALRRLVEFTFDHHHQHESFIRMVMIENIHHADYLDRSEVIRQLNVTAIDNIASIYARGCRRAGSGPVSTPSTYIGRSVRSASSTSPTERPSRASSTATSAAGRRRRPCAGRSSTWCCATSCGRTGSTPNSGADTAAVAGPPTLHPGRHARNS